jgi:hypothetical protein
MGFLQVGSCVFIESMKDDFHISSVFRPEKLGINLT